MERTRYVTVCACLACTGRAQGSVAAMGKESKMEWNVVGVNEISISQPWCLSSPYPYFYMWGLLATLETFFWLSKLGSERNKECATSLALTPVCVLYCGQRINIIKYKTAGNYYKKLTYQIFF